MKDEKKTVSGIMPMRPFFAARINFRLSEVAVILLTREWKIPYMQAKQFRLCHI